MRHLSSLVLLFAAGCASGTRYRVGDTVTYHYSGDALCTPVELRESVVAREGDRLRIDVTARRGAEVRSWVQVLTDSPENQRANRLDALYEEAPDGRLVRLENPDNRDLYRLYEWTVVDPDGKASEVEKAPCERTLGTTYACTCTRGRNAWKGRPVRFESATCPGFVWTHAGSRFWDEETGADVLRVEVKQSSRDPVQPKPLLPDGAR
jgi:hypothetical protein